MTKKPKSKYKPFAVPNDAKLHPILQEQLADLRGGMVGAAERQHLPARFATRQHHTPAVVITDTQTGRAITVPLFAYREVRAALADLFPDEGR
jgi:hypothetical protein